LKLVGAFAMASLVVTALVGSAGAARSVATAITVTVGKPHEISVVFSKSSMIPPGAVAFTVKNGGQETHTFKVCSSPNGGTGNTCSGKAVTVPKSASKKLSLTLKKGKYQYLSTVPGQTVAGLKGLIGVGVVVPKSTSPIPLASSGGGGSTGGGTGTNGSPGAPAAGFPVGNPANGPSLFASAGCGACHSLAAAGSTGTVGPNLNTARPALALAEFRIKNGGLDMPPFDGQLSLQQIADLATWIYNSTH